MKFEEFLIQQPIPSDGRRRRLALQEEVEELQDRLDGELRLNKALRWAMKQADGGADYDLPLPLQLLLAELDMVEEEILWLERRLTNLIHIQSSPTSMPMDIHDALISSRSLCFGPEHPNTISEELLRCLMSVFLKMSSDQLLQASSGKHNAGLSSCIIHNTSSAHPPAASDGPDGLIEYKGYTHITRASFAKPLFDRNTLMPRISVLLKKLCHVDLAFLNYKQKLAFWINVYNACIMNAYLQHGLPSTQDKMLSLMIKAALNVGGIVLNALAIEHYILRHPHDQKQDVEDEKEILLRRAYGLRYPEPNVTFALCRGNWSSPAVYSAEEVVNELEKAKVEYLEAWVGVRRSKKKIVLPKLVRWHMRDFADDLESLVEWIYSQLPHNSLGGLKTRIMECLINSQMKPIRNMVEILPYQYEFRYLIPTPLHKP
ncbi:hypothetical protein V2J09_016335 [Rumex salicifolius]